MTVKNVEAAAAAEPVAAVESRVCECGEHADLVDGACRRCGLDG